MVGKNNKVVKYKNRQLELKKQIKSRKNGRSTFLGTFTLFTICMLYFLEDKLHMYFGNRLNFILFGSVLFVIITFIYLYKNYHAIQKGEKEIKLINNKLYQLLKLKTKDINE